MVLDESLQQRTANEAAVLLNEATRDLLTPIRVMQIARDLHRVVMPTPTLAVSAMLRLAGLSLVMSVYRLKETRENFLDGWLFADSELREFGLPPIEEFVGKEKWNLFALVRHQFAGHATSKEAERGRPGRLVDPAVIGRALRETGLWSESLFARVIDELVPAVERVKSELIRRYPGTDAFIAEYSQRMEAAAKEPDRKEN